MTSSDVVATGEGIRRANEIARRLAAVSASAHLTPTERDRCRVAARQFDGTLDALEAFVAKTERAIAVRAVTPTEAA